MGKFVINFYEPDKNGELILNARVESTGDTNTEAAAKAKKELSSKSPGINLNLWASEGPARR